MSQQRRGFSTTPLKKSSCVLICQIKKNDYIYTRLFSLFDIHWNKVRFFWQLICKTLKNNMNTYMFCNMSTEKYNFILLLSKLKKHFDNKNLLIFLIQQPISIFKISIGFFLKLLCLFLKRWIVTVFDVIYSEKKLTFWTLP